MIHAASAPLAGKNVVIARAAEDGDALCTWLTAHGAHAVALPVIHQVACWDQTEMDAVVSALHDTAWLVFASRNGVRFFAAALDAMQVELPSHVRLAAIGRATAQAITTRWRTPDYVARVSTGAALAAELVQHLGDSPLAHAGLGHAVSTGQIVVPCALEGRHELHTLLAAQGYRVRRLPVYRTVVWGDDGPYSIPAPIFLPEHIDYVMVASPSAARGVCAWARYHGQKALLRATAITMGPTTSEAAQEMGLEVGGEATPHTMDGWRDALLAHAAAAEHVTPP